MWRGGQTVQNGHGDGGAGAWMARWLDQALAPLKGKLDEEQYERLFAAIVSATSLEAFLALRDVCLLDAAKAGEVMCWTAQSILKAVLAEVTTTNQ